jgi:hypothetical protein
MTKAKQQSWKCTKCIPEEPFKTKTALSNHDYNHHCKEFNVTFENEEENDDSKVEENDHDITVTVNLSSIIDTINLKKFYKCINFN